MSTSVIPPGFVGVTGLYERLSKTGKTVYVGKWHAKTVYAIPTEGDDPNAPAFWLCVAQADYKPSETP